MVSAVAAVVMVAVVEVVLSLFLPLSLMQEEDPILVLPQSANCLLLEDASSPLIFFSCPPFSK